MIISYFTPASSAEQNMEKSSSWDLCISLYVHTFDACAGCFCTISFTPLSYVTKIWHVLLLTCLVLSFVLDFYRSCVPIGTIIWPDTWSLWCLRERENQRWIDILISLHAQKQNKNTIILIHFYFLPRVQTIRKILEIQSYK